MRGPETGDRQPEGRRAGHVHEKRVEIRWRDLDPYEHVNNAVYLTYVEEVVDEWLARVLDGAGRMRDYVTARVAIDFRRELRFADEHVVLSCRLVRIGRSSVTTRAELLAPDGALAAEAEVVLVARDAESSASRPLTSLERRAFERDLIADGAG